MEYSTDSSGFQSFLKLLIKIFYLKSIYALFCYDFDFGCSFTSTAYFRQLPNKHYWIPEFKGLWEVLMNKTLR